MATIDVVYVIEYNKISEWDGDGNRHGVYDVPTMPIDTYLDTMARRIHRHIPTDVNRITFANLYTKFRIEWDVSAGQTAIEFAIDTSKWHAMSWDERKEYLRNLVIRPS